MLCTKCGKQMPDYAAFCTACGAPLAQPKPPEAPSENESNDIEQDLPSFLMPDDPFANELPKMDADDDQPPRSKKKLVLAVSLCVLALLLILGAAALTTYLIALQKSPRLASVSAHVDKDGTAYLCYGDGEKLVIYGAQDAILTPDREKIVVLDKEGTLYWTDLALAERHVILEGTKDTEIALDSRWLYNGSFFYTVESPYQKDSIKATDTLLYRYSFGDGSNIKAFAASDEGVDGLVITQESGYAASASVAIARDGRIEVLRADSNEFIKLAEYDKEKAIDLMAVSPDGNTLIWTVEADEFSHALYYSYLDTVTKLKDAAEHINHIAISADNGLAVVVADRDLIYIRGAEYNTASFSYDISGCSTEGGRTIYNDGDTLKDLGCFVRLEGDDICILYYVDFATAATHEILTAEAVFAVSNERIVYKTSEGSYLYAAFDQEKLLPGEGRTITDAKGARFLDLTESTDHIFYCVHNKDYEWGTADLYCYDVALGESKQIATAALSYFKASTDGTKLLYFEGVNLKDAVGTLKMYDLVEGVGTELATGVVIHSVTSHFQNGTVDPDSFFYLTKDYAGKYDLNYFDGERSCILVSSFEY